MSKLRLRSVIEINNINPYVLVNARRVARIRKGWRKPLPVRVRVNGEPEKPWRINLMPVGDGSFYLYLHGDVRKASGTKVGDAVTVELEFDDEYRSGPAHPMPLWFSDALGRNRSARQAWSELIPSRQKGDFALFFPAENARGTGAQSPAGHPRSGRRQRRPPAAS